MAQTPPHAAAGAPQLSSIVAEAAARFDLPIAWIWSVIRAESDGRAAAVSPKGAMGLMQIMPATWSGLRARYGFGADPFNARENVLAGAAYLRELYDEFGFEGFLAAYNAGPGRYLKHLNQGRPLPIETQNYVAKLARTLAGSTPTGAKGPAISTLSFGSGAAVQGHAGLSGQGNIVLEERGLIASQTRSTRAGIERLTPSSRSLFVTLAGRTSAP